ncbi:MAG TPA: hypothetical protein VIF14_11645 [Alphaproteobacteria bacterium]|jgi:hypothetical protein
MIRVQKIENEIRALTAAERSTLRSWFLDYDAELWDTQIEADAAAGKLDKLAKAALDEHRRGKTKKL